MQRSHIVRATLGALALTTLAACGGGDSSDGQFAAGTATYPLACLEHQQQMPGTIYTGGEQGNTAAVFQMLEYFTANKAVTAYCDGKAPSKVDRAWAQTYVDLGAEPANVAHIRG